MSQQWLRLYAETPDDAKLKLLAFEDRWHFIALLCLKAQGLLDDTRPELLDRAVAAKLGLSLRDADEVRRRLAEVDLIGDQWQPLGWDKRQYKSDSSTTRVREWRAAKSPPIPPSEELRTETDTDTELKRCKQRSSNVSETLHLHSTLPTDTWAEWIAHRKSQRMTCSPSALKRQLKLLEQYDTETQRQILDTSMQAGWQGLFPPKGSGRPRPTRYEELMAQAQAPVHELPTPITQFLIGSKA